MTLHHSPCVVHVQAHTGLHAAYITMVQQHGGVLRRTRIPYIIHTHVHMLHLFTHLWYANYLSSASRLH